MSYVNEMKTNEKNILWLYFFLKD